jgi:hypothetical protein
VVRRSTVRIFSLLLLALWPFPLGCAALDKGADTPAAVTDAPEPKRREAEMRKASEIYAAVIRQLVVRDHTFGEAEPPFKVIYVLDGVVPGAANPDMPLDALNPERAFSLEIKEALTQRLRGLPRLVFVARRAAVVQGGGDATDPGRVINRGVLVTLGPIVGRGNRVEVEASLWLNGLAGQWLTYVVQNADDEWRVTGTTGPISVS